MKCKGNKSYLRLWPAEERGRSTPPLGVCRGSDFHVSPDRAFHMSLSSRLVKMSVVAAAANELEIPDVGQDCDHEHTVSEKH